MQWLRSITVSALLLMPYSAYSACDPSTGKCPDCTQEEQVSCAKASAANIGGMTSSQYGSKSALKANIFNPTMKNDTPMTTVDKTASFNAQMLCQSSNKYLEIFVQPTGTGDLAQIMVSQDIDMDNTIDSLYVVPFSVSGVCANGVIACTPGTWTNCISYKWIADGSAVIGLSEVPLTELGGCYCVNQACGNNLVWNNFPVILKDIGGGVVGAIQAVNPKYAVSDVKIQDTTISYYGQKSGSCSMANTSYGSTDPQKYKSNWSQIASDVETEKTSQTADPKSYYSTISNAFVTQQMNADVRNCQINRNLYCPGGASLDYAESITDLCTNLQSDPECKLRDEKTDSVFTWQNFNPTNLKPLQSCKLITCQVEAECVNSELYNWSQASVGACNAVPYQGAWLDIVKAISPQMTVGEDTGYFTCNSGGTVCGNGSCNIQGVSGTLTTLRYCVTTCTHGGEECTTDCNLYETVCQGKTQPCAKYGIPSHYNCGGSHNIEAVECYWDEGSENCNRVGPVNRDGEVQPISICDGGTCEIATPQVSYTNFVPAGNAFTGTARGTVDDWGACSMYFIAIYDELGAVVAYDKRKFDTGLMTEFNLVYLSPKDGNYTAKIWIAQCNWDVNGGDSYCNGIVRRITCPLDEHISCVGEVGGTSMCNKFITHNVCPEWWGKDRTYLCQNSPFDFSDIKKRVTAVTKSLNNESGSVYYQDVRKDNEGNWITEDGTFNASQQETYSDCEKACKTKKPKEDTQVSTEGTTADFRNTVQSYDFFYKVCANDICPVTSADEEIVIECQCIDEFGDAAVSMQLLRVLGKDMICTSGVAKPLDQ